MATKTAKHFTKKCSDASRTRELAYLIKRPASILEALDTEVKKKHIYNENVSLTYNFL